MRGKLSDKLFPGIVRDLSRENAPGRLRLTQCGDIKEILIEAGVPVFASSTIPEEQPEHKLVQEGLITPEQLDAAILISKQTSQPVEKILVQTKAITRLALQQILCELSTIIINSAAEWIDGDYQFVAAPKVPLEAKLIWTCTECTLGAVRQASSNKSVLEALAPVDGTVGISSDPSNITAHSATLSSTEGYVLSCIQSPTSLAEASMLTGLSHTDTRRAILVLLMLGLLEAEGDTLRAAAQPTINAEPRRSYFATRHEPQPAAQSAPPTKSVASPEAVAHTPVMPQISTQDSAVFAAPSRLQVGHDGSNPPATLESEAWPLKLGSNTYAGMGEDAGQLSTTPATTHSQTFRTSRDHSKVRARELTCQP